ncbi:VID27 cytoplasmic protein-domain-containing protein [Fennellomyces sp. T-0311]|nr:VID27 cytoplasmic protein-domain-containing protein [Fennellomyces sp. T-0311]
MYEFICNNDITPADLSTFASLVYQYTNESGDGPLTVFGHPQGSQRLLRKPSVKQSKPAISAIINIPFKYPKGIPAPPDPQEYLVSIQADLFIYLPNEERYVPQEELVDVDLVSYGSLNHWLLIRGTRIPSFSHCIDRRTNANFNKEGKIMVLNYFEGEQCYSLLLKIVDTDDWQELTAGMGQCIYEASSQVPFSKSCKGDQEFVINAIENEALLAFNEREENEDGSGDEEIDTDDDGELTEDEDYYKTLETFLDGSGKNKVMTISYKQPAAYVFRGDKLGIYRSVSTKLRLSSAIPNLSSKNVQHAMLYRDESALLVMKDDSRVAQIDIERNLVVDEWGMEDDPRNSKYAQMTDEATFIGITSNAVFRIDPRIPGRVVQQQCKRHVVKTDFSAVSTSQSGHIAVGSRKGDIRLFEEPGRVARTTLPPLGEHVYALDISLDGRYMLATCQYYLMLFDVMHKDSRQVGLRGSREKPVPKLLKIRPEHVSLMNEPIAFTHAKFGTSQGDEKYIISSTGSYIVEWSIANVCNGKPYPYTMRKFDNHIISAAYNSGCSGSIIVALPDEVTISTRSQLEKPSNRFFLRPRKKASSGYE